MTAQRPVVEPRAPAAPDAKMANYLASIQALRAVAALSITCVHFTAMCFMLLGRPADPIPVAPMASGVDLFFVISGFIMVVSSEKLFGTARAPFLFFARRLARIVPIYWVTTVASVALLAPAWSPETLTKSLLFIPYVGVGGKTVPVYGVGWTLNFEMFFYTLFCVAIRLPRDQAVLFLSGLMCAFVVLGSGVSLPVPFSVWADPIILEFVMGMLLAVVYRRGVRLPFLACTCLVFAGAFAVWFSHGSGVPTGFRWVRWGIPATAIIAAAALSKPSQRGWKIPQSLIVLGNASYSIYLIHGLVLGALFLVWVDGLIAHSTPVWRVAIIGEVLTILLSILTYYQFERPVVAFITQRLERFNVRVVPALPRA